MRTGKRMTLVLLGLLCAQRCCSLAEATPPQIGNPVLRIQRDQMAHALGESSLKVISSGSRVLLEGKSQKPLQYRKAWNASDSERKPAEADNAESAIFPEVSTPSQGARQSTRDEPVNKCRRCGLNFYRFKVHSRFGRCYLLKYGH